MRHLNTLFTGLVIGLCLSPAAFAIPIVIDLTSPDSRTGVYNSTYAKQYNYEEDNLGLEVTGWSYGTKITPTQECTKRNHRGVCTKYKTVNLISSNEAIEQEYIGKWDGLGVEKTDSPNHAVDNEAGDYDMHLLSFDELVKLTALDIGWFMGDTDISILAYRGSSFNSTTLLGKKWQELIGNGWDLVGNYYNVDSNYNNGLVNQDGIIAKYWLVGTYNPGFGTTFSGPNKNATRSEATDYYKLKTLTVERPIPDAPPPVDVPEPSSLLLLALGLLGLGWVGRQQPKA